MKYVSNLLENQMFLENLQLIEQYEQDRIYCRHGFAHLMDVARLGWQYALERGLKLDKEQLYLAALLHDIGRAKEYENGISHATAGKQLAGEILLHIGYPQDKTEEITEAIAGHRMHQNPKAQKDPVEYRVERRWADTVNEQEKQAVLLAAVLKEADKASRACFICKAADSCKWSEEKRNTRHTWT